MEKLIELLNEYEIEREEKIELFNDKEKPLWEWYKDCAGYLTFEPTDNNKMNGEAFSGDTAHSVIISKSYGFIKWLVENNRIDIERLHKIVDYRLEIKGNYVNAHDYNSDCLIMLLAISNTPISDLISYLK